MIVRMSKVEIVGPRESLEPVLSLLRETGMLQIEPDIIGFIDRKDKAFIDSFLPDERTVLERIYFEELRGKISELFSYLQSVPERESYIDPASIVDTIRETVQKHLQLCRDLWQKQEALHKEHAELKRHTLFLDAIEPLLEGLKESPDVEFLGITLKDPESTTLLRNLLRRHADDKFELLTTDTTEGGTAGLIIIAKEMSDPVKNVLSDRDIPEIKFPPAFNDLTFLEKLDFIRTRIAEIESEIDAIHMQLESFALKWGAVYRALQRWIEERLSVLKVAASVFETKMCFFIYGWMATEDVTALGSKLDDQFSGGVVLKEIELRAEDLERTPVILKNPAYFKPFELFTRILPLPRYTSYDPTPFIGIFLPVFFGMILGDAGYGLLLMIISFFLVKKCGKHPYVQDAGRILGIASVYTIIFGVLYGEYWGELGSRLFGLRPLILDRRTSVMPMLYFSVTIGVAHVLLGSCLGFLSALKRRTKKEAVSKLCQIAIILCLLILIASLFGVFPVLLTKPVILAILVITPFLLFTGGILAPLELIKSISNIISYARIMAIGLSSVLLAFVANHLAGMTGDIVLGVLVAGLLHLVNIVIGVFSPTIHSLRLHYVEFFSKFIESGGKKFQPLRKEKHYVNKQV
jgi:V/A-type H+-transporting ATPase subunit I